MKRLLTIAVFALLNAGSSYAYDAAQCTELLTGTWKWTDLAAKTTLTNPSMTATYGSNGGFTTEFQMAGQPPEVRTGEWSTLDSSAPDECKFRVSTDGSAGTTVESRAKFLNDRTMVLFDDAGFLMSNGTGFLKQ